VEHLREPHFASFETVRLTVLGSAGYTTAAHALTISGPRMRLVLDRPISPATLVRIQGDDWFVLGEVSYCEMERSHYNLGIEIEHSLAGLGELARLNQEEWEIEPSARLQKPEQFIA